MKYNIPEDNRAMASEPVATYGGTTGITNLCTSVNTSTPYTLEELNMRIDESEKQMECGEVANGDEVHKQMREYLNSLAV